MQRIVINHGVTHLWMSKKGLERLAELGNKEAQCNLEMPDEFDNEIYYYGYLHNTPRDDPNLIKVIEELGAEATADCNPYIVNIPDDVEWEIDQYDGGHEFVREKSRKWYFNDD